MKKRNFKTKHKLICLIALIVIIVAFFSKTLDNKRNLNKVESLIKDSTTSIIKVVTYPAKFIINKVSNYFELINIRKKYDLLLPEIDRIDSLYTENIELRKQLSNLKEELNITNTINDYSYLNATVIERNITHWYNTITIDKGSYHGIELDMAVVSSRGLIGKVVSTTTFTSEVRLITTSDTKNKISVVISDGNTHVTGLIKGYNYQTNYLEVEGVSNTEKIGEDYKVYTSGLGGVFPSGILIGITKNITTDEYDLTKIIDVLPSVDFNDINYVAILKREEVKE